MNTVLQLSYLIQCMLKLQESGLKQIVIVNFSNLYKNNIFYDPEKKTFVIKTEKNMARNK